MKIVGFSILAIAILCGTEINASTESCTPGEIMMKDCNTCVCIYGSGYACTKNVCLEGMLKKDDILKGPLGGSTPGSLRDKRQANPTEGTCEPGEVFKHYCNDCHCGPDGLVRSAACTKLGCPEGIFNEDGSINQPLTDPIPRDKRQAGGVGATCVPGTSFKQYCNTCYCPEYGRRDSASCTLMGCVGNWNEDGSLKAPLSDPIPRDKRQAGGVGATCVPGTSFKQYCNTCYCPENGRRDSAFCTLIGCVGNWNEDGSLKAPFSDPTPRDKRQAASVGATCVPGTSFKQYCNTCYCPGNGRRDSASCTLMGCVGNWNEDGSLKAPLSDPIPRDKRQAAAPADTCVPGTYTSYFNTICKCPANGLHDYTRCVSLHNRAHL